MNDTQPVFDAIIANCSNLFHGDRVVLFLSEGDQYRAHASNGQLTGKSRAIDRDSAVGACLADARLIHLPDLELGARGISPCAPDGAGRWISVGAVFAAAAR